MATRQADGSIKMTDGRVIYANSLVLAQDLIEIIPLFSPPPAWPFVSGGGGGGGGSGPGTPGAPGAPGTPGLQGNQGNQGVPGPFGGPQGNQGNQGSGGTGAQGNQGNQGLTGSGAQGNQGNQGNAGTNGTNGAQGNQGFQGLTGSGAQGNQGNQGNQGLQGTNPGPQGPQGVGGGAQGAQGNQGFQGTNPGAQGAQGPQGSGTGGGATDFLFTFSGTLSTIQNVLIPPEVQLVPVTTSRLDVYLQVASQGQDVKVSFFMGVTLLGTVTVTAGTTSGTQAIGPTLIPAGTVVTAQIIQVGTTVVGETASMYVRSS